jgi:hypothetical protein
VTGFDRRAVLACLALASLVGCTTATLPSDAPRQPRGFQLEDVARGDVDMVAETHLALGLGYLETLMVKLYRRNPNQLRRGGHEGIAEPVSRVFGAGRPLRLAEFDGRGGVATVQLAFDERYDGDRVLAFIEGLRGMLLESYGGRRDFYLTHDFDPQKLYNAARNLEVAAWKLAQARDAAGRLYLLSNQGSGPVVNLSFERLFGKLIALQDAMALVVADTSSRQIKTVIQSVASMVFLPI